jgi:cytochrome oxidase Cu insertion factor (SCO1/SenC/PrrC family)
MNGWSVSRRRSARGLAGVLLLTLSIVFALPVRGDSPPRELKSLVDQNGARFSFEQLKGRTVVMNFIFTSCPVSCPLQTSALAAVQRALPAALHDRVQFVSVTVDPAHDRPAVLKQFARQVGADLGNWSFVTGNDDEITSLHQQFDARVKKLDGGGFDHRVAVYLIESHGRVIQRYTGDLDRARLVREIGDVDRLYNRS